MLTLDDLVYMKKTAIKEGLIREMEETRKGSVILVLVLLANTDPETKIVEMTYKEMMQQTGYTKETVRQILNILEVHMFFTRESKQGSRKTRLKMRN
jgi:transcription initiation factor IIE alpha subunit